MEMTIKGDGKLIVRLVDAKGRTMMEQQITATGSPTVQAKASVPLELDVGDGLAPVAPVLAYQSNARQKVRFDGQTPARFTRKRCREMSCSGHVAQRAARGSAKALVPAGLDLPTPEIESKRKRRTKRSAS